MFPLYLDTQIGYTHTQNWYYFYHSLVYVYFMLHDITRLVPVLNV